MIPLWGSNWGEEVFPQNSAQQEVTWEVTVSTIGDVLEATMLSVPNDALPSGTMSLSGLVLAQLIQSQYGAWIKFWETGNKGRN